MAADPQSLTPDLIEVLLRWVERLGLPTVLAGGLLWIILRLTGLKLLQKPLESDTRWREAMETRIQQLADRVIRLEAQQEDRWEWIRMYILPKVRQPLHTFMDNLLDKLHQNHHLTYNELLQLEAELMSRLQEEEPANRPGYKLYVLEALDYVTWQRRKRDAARGNLQ